MTTSHSIRLRLIGKNQELTISKSESCTVTRQQVCEHILKLSRQEKLHRGEKLLRDALVEALRDPSWKSMRLTVKS